MASTRLSIPSSNSRLTFTLNDFSGGLVNTVNDVKMLDNQSPDMLNMQFRNDGLIQKRPGLIHVETTIENDTLVDCIHYEYEPEKFLKLYQNPYQLYYKGKGGVPYVIWEHPIAKVPVLDEEGNPNFAHMGVSRRLTYVHFMGSLIFTEGKNLYMFTYEPSKSVQKTYKLVNCPDTFTPKPKPALTGTYKEKLIESYKLLDYKNPSFTWGTTTCGQLYEKWYEPCEYETEDGYKGKGLLPPSIGVLTVHKDRLYVSGSAFAPNMIWISDILNPYYFPSSLTLQTPPDDDYITALHVYNDNLIIGRKNTIFALFGNTNRDDSAYQYQLVQINCHTGMPNGYSANQVYHMLFFVGTDGNMYKLLPPSTVSDSLYTTKLNNTLDITLPPFNLKSIDCMYALSVFDSKEDLWYIQIGDHTLVYNYQLMSWTRYNNINAVRFYKRDNDVYFIMTTGSIYRLPSRSANQKYYDEIYDSFTGKVLKLPVCAYWTSRNMDMGQPARVKQFRDTYITSESFEDYSTTVNVKYEVDYVDIYESFLIQNEISKWNKAKFDVNKFSSRNIDRSLPLMINRRGRTVKVYYGCGYEFVGSYETLPPPGAIEEYKILYAKDTAKMYIRVPRMEGFVSKYESYYKELSNEEYSQALLVHNITGIYELKGYR